MRKLLLTVLFLILCGAITGAGSFFWGFQKYSEAGSLIKTSLFIIKKGQAVSSIANRLVDQKIISNALVFEMAARLTHVDTALKAGEYQFSEKSSIENILLKMRNGSIYQRQFTVPEGLTSWQIVNLLNNVKELEGKIEPLPKEGSLLPETYNFVRGDTRQDKILQMQTAMKETLEDLEYNKPKNAPLLSLAEAVILASIVEKETALPEERRRISGVFHNRLKKGIKLQTDPTVIYALTNGKIQDNGKGPLGRRLLTKDLKFESPYNSYKYSGLPPGPIANPGRASLEAAFNPEKHDYYYFVADGHGGHVFSKTLKEHNKNVAKWRKIRKERDK